MTRVDLHPEDLFDHLRHGELRDDERQRLTRHCAQCSACAFELSLIEASAHEAQPSADDHTMAAHAVARMWQTDDAVDALPTDAIDAGRADTTITASDVPPVIARAQSHAVFRAAALLLAGVLVGGSVSAAALTGGSPFVLVELITGWVTPTTSEAETMTAAPDARAHKRRAKVASRTPVVEPVAPAPIAVAVVTPAEEAVVTPAAPIDVSATPIDTAAVVAPRRVNPPARGMAGGPAPMPPVVQAPAADPATWLFRAASRARSAGRHQEAAALYGVLQRDYAGSETEVVARVALGRLWLGHLNDPAAALDAFESYLEARADGPLSEEARSGRVLALRRLGRLEEAEQARHDLLLHHPTTLYAKSVTGAP